ncbi:hypothetical protein EIP86_000220 [Pleurotus ostreatoroseus]|nr:hypothetical protein EIP86_000220 [Pleurotus ostreatoroseus]
MLNTLPYLPHSRLPSFLLVLTPLANSHPYLFEPHLPALLKFLPGLILPSVDAGPTPTVSRPNPDGPSFTFPPPSVPDLKGKSAARNLDDDESDEVRKAALEFMVTLSEARPSMARSVNGWVAAIVRGCLEGMGEIPEDDTEVWLEADPADDPTDDNYPRVYEEALDRIAIALGGKSVLQPAFAHIPGMLVSPDWRVRHAGLMAIASIAEGTCQVLQKELGKIVEVSAHAAAALINFCEGVERDTLIPYLDEVVERLLKLLNPGTAGKTPKRYVQEQAITTLAMVADASEATFAKNANTPDYKTLRVKAMECAGLIAIAVGRDVFRPDSSTFIEQLMRIQSEIFRPIIYPVRVFKTDLDSPHDSNDTMLDHYLIATWAKVCQALGPEFEPYLPVVMPPLFTAAAIKPDLSIYDEDAAPDEQEGWESFPMDGHRVSIKTSSLEEKLVPILLACGKNSGTLTPQMVNASFSQVVNCIAAEKDPTFFASLYRCFNDCMRVAGGPEGLPDEVKEAAIEATKRQLSLIADRRKSRAGLSAKELDDDREDIKLVQEIEDYGFEDMIKMVSTINPEHPLLIAIASVKDLALDLGDSEDEVEEG